MTKLVTSNIRGTEDWPSQVAACLVNETDVVHYSEIIDDQLECHNEMQ